MKRIEKLMKVIIGLLVFGILVLSCPRTPIEYGVNPEYYRTRNLCVFSILQAHYSGLTGTSDEWQMCGFGILGVTVLW